MRLGSLFSGYGGLDLAVQSVLGTSTAWVADIEPGPKKILAHRFPDAPNLGDVTKVDWASVEPVDVLAGGFPCQDVSQAGRRAGMTEGTRSNLWGVMRTAIEELQPQLVVAENVRGLLSARAKSDSDMEHSDRQMGAANRDNLRAIGRVLGDLADIGFDASWYGLRASDVGAPHQRMRIFIVAENTNLQRGSGRAYLASQSQSKGADTQAGRADSRPDSPRHTGLALLPTPRATQGGSHTETAQLLLQPTPEALFEPSGDPKWREYLPAITRWERLMGRPAPEPLMANGKHRPRLAPPFVEWMMGLPAGWVTDVPGITRAEANRALGNGVVPQQGAVAIHEALHMLDQSRELARP